MTTHVPLNYASSGDDVVSVSDIICMLLKRRPMCLSVVLICEVGVSIT